MVQTVLVAPAAIGESTAAAAKRSANLTLTSSWPAREKKAGGEPPAGSAGSYLASAKVRRQLSDHAAWPRDALGDLLGALRIAIATMSREGHAAAVGRYRGGDVVQRAI